MQSYGIEMNNDSTYIFGLDEEGYSVLVKFDADRSVVPRQAIEGQA